MIEFSLKIPIKNKNIFDWAIIAGQKSDANIIMFDLPIKDFNKSIYRTYTKYSRRLCLASFVAQKILSEVEHFKNLNKKPDIIILDYRMPNKNGIQILEEILQIDNTSKIIFASADNKIKIEALSKGAKFFLDKPFSLKELYKTVLKLLKRKDIKINTSIIG